MLAVRHVPTGRSWRARASVMQEAHGTLAVDVVVEGDDKRYHVGLDDFPEREAAHVRRVLRRVLRADVLTEEDEHLILDAGLPYARVIGDALVRQLPADPARANGIDVDRIRRTLDLMRVEGYRLPFDAQTRFYRLMTEGSASLRATLAPLIDRFGFAIGAFGESSGV